MLSLTKKTLVGSRPPSLYEAFKGCVLSLRERSHSDLDVSSFNPEWACSEFGASFFASLSFEFVRFVKYALSSFMVQDNFAPRIIWGL